jgi:citrate lyase beta subunit
MDLNLDLPTVQPALDRLAAANAAFMARYPGESGQRQPVHTVYGGAQIFKHDTAQKLGAVALRALEEFAPDAKTLARAVDLADSNLEGSLGSTAAQQRSRLIDTVYARVVEKLKREPVEDFRIDFEDGYGNRPDAEEDADAIRCAEEVATGYEKGTLPPFIGIRIKPLTEELHGRSLRTLERFISKLTGLMSGKLPPNFVVTLPKVTIPEQVRALVSVLEALEHSLGLAKGSLQFEIMVETPQAIIGSRGECQLPAFVDAGEGRVTGAHFGTYDYTASVNITAAHQRMRHPACDFAKHVMQVSLAGTGVRLSDGSTTIMPVAPHKAEKGGSLSASQVEENRQSVHRAWKLHYDDVQHSLVNGIYQGWDLHPAQLPTRYAAVYTFFLSGLDAAGARLKNFVQRAAQATLIGDVFDDAATGQGLLNYFLRAINSGAITEEEAVEMTGVTLEELRARSFVMILRNRR